VHVKWGQGSLVLDGGYSFAGCACRSGARSSFVVQVFVYVGGACSCGSGSDDGVIVPTRGVPAS
jgi:hypothetical protein